jgi:hypothetical protein
MAIKTLLSIGCNRKLGKKIGVFNLPSGCTCPGKTPLCTGCCYAKKAERCYPSARNKRQENLVVAMSPDFGGIMAAEVLKSGVLRVRIHESGDFFDQYYLDKWISVAQMCPLVNFLAFTKSFTLDFNRRPPNLVIYASVDPTTPGQPPVPAGLFTASLVPKGGTPAPGGHVCQPMVVTKKHNYCGDGCDYCWKNQGFVQWIQH